MTYGTGEYRGEAVITEYAVKNAKEKGAAKDFAGGDRWTWWLIRGDVIDKDGYHYYGGVSGGATTGYVGVRPVIYINLNACKGDVSESMQMGSSGDEVQRLQQALIDQGFLSGKADGDFGNKTFEAVKAAQKAFGMKETGIADSLFLEHLYAERQMFTAQKR